MRAPRAPVQPVVDTIHSEALKISIITVAYNSARTIGDTLRSVMAQTHPDIEHIVIDGGSSDDTLEVVRLEGAHVAHVVSEPDGGIYDAMNKGLRCAQGDYVGFLNADDVLADPDAIASVVRAAQAQPDVIYGDLVYVANDDLQRVVRSWKSGAFSRTSLKFGWMPPHPTFYVRRTSTQALSGFDTSLNIAADYDFMLRCLVTRPVTAAYVPRVLVRMRTGGASNGSVSAIARKSREDLRVIRRHGLDGWFTLACKNMRKIPQFIRK